MQTLLNPTPEQAAILDSTAKITRIDARAGTGKTTTLQLLADQYPNDKILYLVFNRRAKEEAKLKFPQHVHIHTIHSLAFSASQRESRSWKLDDRRGGSFGIHDLLNRFGHLGSKQQVVAALAFEFLNYFLNSEFQNQDQAIESFAAQFLGDNQRPDFDKYLGTILEVCKEKTAAWYAGDEMCPHDFYLKLAHVQGQIDQRLRQYDMILVDEGQDLTQVTLDSLSKFAGRIFLVGDAHQQLYRFRYAINAMASLRPDAEYELSLSFRFGSEIADVVSQFIRKTKQAHSFNIEGNPEIASQVYLHSGIANIKYEAGSALLSRTNFSLFESAVELYERNVQCRFVRGIRPILFQALDTYNLSTGENEKIRDPLIKSFDAIDEMKEYAEEIDDYAKLALIKIVEKHKKEMPGLIFDIRDAEKESRELRADEAVTLATVHTAKGSEYDRVYLHEDLVTSLSRELKDTDSEFEDETNIVYVAMTRAARELHLPVELRDEVKLNWRSLIQGQSEETLKYSYVKKQEEAKQPEHEFALGDQVRTRSGVGDIIEVAEDGMLLIKLHDQPYKVRERKYEVQLLIPAKD
jgi:superfamily I DNA/RNA helicase